MSLSISHVTLSIAAGAAAIVFVAEKLSDAHAVRLAKDVCSPELVSSVWTTGWGFDVTCSAPVLLDAEREPTAAMGSATDGVADDQPFNAIYPSEIDGEQLDF
jgi:hypothetical protein